MTCTRQTRHRRREEERSCDRPHRSYQTEDAPRTGTVLRRYVLVRFFHAFAVRQAESLAKLPMNGPIDQCRQEPYNLVTIASKYGRTLSQQAMAHCCKHVLSTQICKYRNVTITKNLLRTQHECTAGDGSSQSLRATTTCARGGQGQGGAQQGTANAQSKVRQVSHTTSRPQPPAMGVGSAHRRLKRKALTNSRLSHTRPLVQGFLDDRATQGQVDISPFILRWPLGQ